MNGWKRKNTKKGTEKKFVPYYTEDYIPFDLSFDQNASREIEPLKNCKRWINTFFVVVELDSQMVYVGTSLTGVVRFE